MLNKFWKHQKLYYLCSNKNKEAMSQIETQLRTIDYLSRLQYQKHLKNLSVLTDSKDEKERYKKVIQLIDNLNAVNFEFSN
jgi:hypothetical protein